MLWIAGGIGLLIITAIYAAVARQDRLHGGTAKYQDKKAQRSAMKRANR